MIGAAVLVVWLLLVWLLSHFITLHGIGRPQPAPQSDAPTSANNTPRPPGPRDADGDRDVVRYLIASTVALLAMIVVGAVVAARRRRVGVQGMAAAQPLEGPTPTVASTSLVRAAESG